MLPPAQLLKPAWILCISIFISIIAKDDWFSPQKVNQQICAYEPPKILPTETL